MLVSSRVKDGQLWFEVHKEGLSFLRSFKNKRLRIIFNISQSTKSLQPFNRHFLSQPVPQQNPPCSPAPYHSIIQISPIFKELQDNRVIIFLNVYHNNNDVLEEMKDNAKSPHVQILVIGYLIASVFMYHHEGKLGDPADPFCTILGKLGIMLKDTDVNQLQQEIKYTTGFAKKPYFMCLCKEKQADTDANYHQLFRQTYKYQEGQDKLNEAVDTLIDYFPQRTAIYIGDYEDSIEQQQRIEKLGTGYEKQILGRHIFNFQLTAGTVESLCFQLCEQFNKKKNENRNINLLKIYNKIIINQKSQILSIMTQNYKNIMDELYKKLPMENVELNQCYYNIEKYILQEAIDYGCNCMSFYEFVHTYSSIRPLFSKGFQSLLASNKEVKRNLALEAFQNVEDHLPVKPESPSLLHCLQSIKGYSQCLDIFIQSTIQDFTMRDLLCRLLQKNTEEVYQQLQQVQSEYRKQMKHYEQRISSLELQNKAYQYKFKQFQSQFIYLHAINQEFKQKLLSGSGTGSGSGISNGFDKGAQLKQSEVVLELKKRILDLQFQMYDKNSVINSLSQILDRLEVEMSRKYHKQKFSKQTQSFLSQLTQKCHSLYSLFAQLQKTHSFYTTIQSQYELKKQQIYNQQQKQKQKIEQQKQKINQFIKQRKFMQQIINEEKRSIDVLEKVQLEYKDALEEMENIGSRGKCQLAELEGMFEKWKKALELVVGFVVTGKNQRLRDFYKVCMEVDLKEVLKPIFKK